MEREGRVLSYPRNEKHLGVPGTLSGTIGTACGFLDISLHRVDVRQAHLDELGLVYIILDQITG